MQTEFGTRKNDISTQVPLVAALAVICLAFLTGENAAACQSQPRADPQKMSAIVVLAPRIHAAPDQTHPRFKVSSPFNIL